MRLSLYLVVPILWLFATAPMLDVGGPAVCEGGEIENLGAPVRRRGRIYFDGRTCGRRAGKCRQARCLSHIRYSSPADALAALANWRMDCSLNLPRRARNRYCLRADEQRGRR